MHTHTHIYAYSLMISAPKLVWRMQKTVSGRLRMPVSAHMYVCMYVCMHMQKTVSGRLRMPVSSYVYMYVCMYAHAETNLRMQNDDVCVRFYAYICIHVDYI